MVLNVLRLDAKLGEFGLFALILVRGHLQEIGIEAFPLGLKARHVKKVSRMSVDGRRIK